MVTLKDVVFGVALPALIAGAVVLLAWAARRMAARGAGAAVAERASAGTGGVGALARWGGALGLCGGVIAAQLALIGGPSLAALPSQHGLLWVLVVGALAGGALGDRRGGWAWGVRVVVAVFAAWLVSRWMIGPERWGGWRAVVEMAGRAGAILLFWTLLDRAMRSAVDERRWLGAALVPATVAGLGAQVLVFGGGVAVLGQLSGAAAVALLAAGTAGGITRTAALGSGAAAVVGLFLPALWIDAHLSTEYFHWGYGVGLALSPGAAIAAGAIPRVRRAQPWVRTLVQAAAVSAAAGAVLAVAVWRAPVDDYLRSIG